MLWPVIVGLATGVPDAFFQTQAAWGQRPADGPFLPWLHLGLGRARADRRRPAARRGRRPVLRVLAGRHTAWLVTELRVFGVAYPVYLLAVVRPITSMWRFLLLDLPIAAALASAGGRGAREHVGRGWWWRVAAAGRARRWPRMSWWTAVYLTRVPWGDSPP